MTAQINYSGDLRTTAVHLRSEKILITDAPVDNNGKGEAFSPTDLTATSLACCMLTIMGIRANARNISIDGAKAAVKKVMASDPRRISEIHVDLYLPREDYSEKDKAILEKGALECPVAQSLHPDIKQQVQFHYEQQS